MSPPAGARLSRMPPLTKLRVKTPNGVSEKPCISIMSSVLACWASAGYSTAACYSVEQQLRNCMDAPPAPKVKSSEVNYHLARFKDRMTQNARKKR